MILWYGTNMCTIYNMYFPSLRRRSAQILCQFRLLLYPQPCTHAEIQTGTYSVLSYDKESIFYIDFFASPPVMSGRRPRTSAAAATAAATTTTTTASTPTTPTTSGTASTKTNTTTTPTVGRSKRKVVPLAEDSDKVLRKCRQLRDSMRLEADDNSSIAEPAGIPRDIIEVADLSSPQVLEAMESVALNIAHQVLNRKGFTLDIPSRANSNQIYVKEWDRIVLGGKRSTRTFLNVKEARKSAITLRGALYTCWGRP